MIGMTAQGHRHGRSIGHDGQLEVRWERPGDGQIGRAGIDEERLAVPEKRNRRPGQCGLGVSMGSDARGQGAAVRRGQQGAAIDPATETRRASARRSRRTVSSDTPNCAARSLARTLP